MLTQRYSLTVNILLLAILIGVPYLFLWGYLLQSGRIDWGILSWVGGLLIFNAVLLIRFVSGVVQPLTKVGQGLTKFAKGDFTVRVPNPYQGEFKQMLDDVNQSFVAIQNMMEGMLDNTVNIASANFETVAATAKVVFNVEKEEVHIQGISSSVEGINLRMSEIAENVAHSRDTANSMNKEVQTGNSIVTETISRMAQIAESVHEAEETVQRLGNSSQQISEITQVISDIANQTNLLALNAAIEAARAGESGRGFAVVADEVRKLAERTAGATQEISSKISAIQSETSAVIENMSRSVALAQQGREVTQRVEQAFQEIQRKIEIVTEQIGQITIATEGQKSATSEISKGIAVISEVTKNNTSQAYVAIESISNTNSVIGKQLQILEQFEIQDKLLLVAKSDHVLWKKRLNEMLLGSVEIRPEELADHHQCRLGKWYYNEGIARFADNQDFKAIEEPHRKLHEVARRVSELYHEGNKPEAQQLVDDLHPHTEKIIKYLDNLHQAAMVMNSN